MDEHGRKSNDQPDEGQGDIDRASASHHQSSSIGRSGQKLWENILTAYKLNEMRNTSYAAHKAAILAKTARGVSENRWLSAEDVVHEALIGLYCRGKPFSPLDYPNYSNEDAAHYFFRTGVQNFINNHIKKAKSEKRDGIRRFVSPVRLPDGQWRNAGDLAGQRHHDPEELQRERDFLKFVNEKAPKCSTVAECVIGGDMTLHEMSKECGRSVRWVQDRKTEVKGLMMEYIKGGRK